MRTSLRAVLVTLGALVATSGAVLGTGSAGAVGTGTISGSVVTDDANAWPVSSLRVSAYRLVGGTWQQEASVFEPSSGTYEITGLTPGSYRIEIVNQSGYYKSEWYADAPTLETATDLAVTDGGTVTANAALTPSPQITGWVNDGEGHGLDFIGVRAYRLVDGTWKHEWGATSEPSGLYRIGNLTPGTYRVCSVVDAFWLASCWGGGSDVATATSFEVTAGNVVNGKDLQIDPAAFATGTVRVWDAIDGTDLVAGAGVTAYKLVEGSWVADRTAATRAGTFNYGEYDLGGLAPGTYRFRADPPGDYAEFYKPRYYPASDTLAGASDVVIPAGGVVENIDFVLQPSKAFTLTQAPALSGTPQVGKPLTAKPAAWTPTPETITYVWLADGQYAGETEGPVWKPSIRELGKRISVRVTADSLHMRYAEATTGKTAPVLPGPLTNNVLPAISGSAKVGRQLSVTGGKWTPARVTVSYQWFANGKKIAGATRPVFRPTAAQRGKRITAKVTARAKNYLPTTVTTKATKKVKG